MPNRTIVGSLIYLWIAIISKRNLRHYNDLEIMLTSKE
jgi:hypothetical protein